MPSAVASTSLERDILDEARRALVEKGYTALSMRRIAEAVGCTATSIYLYFRDKDALFHALIDEGFAALNARLQQAADGDSRTEGADDPLQRVRRLCTEYVRFGLDNPEFYEIMFMLHPEHTQRYPAIKYRRARRGLELFAEALRRLPDRETASDDELRLLATTVWCSLHGTVSLLVSERVDVRVDRDMLLDRAVQLGVDAAAGLGATTSSPSPTSRAPASSSSGLDF